MFETHEYQQAFKEALANNELRELARKVAEHVGCWNHRGLAVLEAFDEMMGLEIPE